MSSGVKGAAANSRVSIPSSVRKMIENIQEITGQNHSEDEIHAMLKECSMDPNETTQKLLLLDTFHEVKRKRDRRKENQNKEPAESKWKAGSQPKGQRSGQGNYSSRYMSHDGGERNPVAFKETVNVQNSEKGNSKVPLFAAQEARKNENSLLARPITPANGLSGITSQSTNVRSTNHGPVNGGVNQYSAAGNANSSKLDGPLSSTNENPTPLGTSEMQQPPRMDTNNRLTSVELVPAAGIYFSPSDPVLPSFQDSPSSLPAAEGTHRHEARDRCIPVENPTNIKPASPLVSSSENGKSNLQQKVPNDLGGVGENQHVESLHPVPTTVVGPAVSIPSSNYNNRYLVIGSQKVPGKEWKPKSTTATAIPTASPEVSMESVGSTPESHPISAGLTSEDTTQELQRQLEESRISGNQHVIIPNHLHVPEAGKLGFCFGSFDASFGLDVSRYDGPGTNKSAPLSDSSEDVDEPVMEQQLSDQNASVSVEDTEIKYHDQPQSPSPGPEKFTSTAVELSSSVPPDYIDNKQEIVPGNHQHPMLHASSNYNFGFMPPMLSNQLTPLESLEALARDTPRLPGFVVQQSIDPTSYYAQLYRSGMDGDGRVSPFAPVGATNKHSGDAAVASAQTSQTPQEDAIPLVLPAASQTPLVTQAAGIMQSSITAAQQPLQVFRQPTGVHLPHYPPNYFPYAPYFSPIYVPPPAIHRFMSSGAFPQQPQTGGLYPIALGTNAKYSVSQYKQGSNTGNASQIGVPGSYGPYGLSNYPSASTPAAVTSTSEDLSAPPVKKNNIFVGGQQSEGSGVWFTTTGRDISSLLPSSFYNIPQGQMAFSPAQTGHGAFTSIYHPAQAVSAATVHPFLQQSQSITTPAEMLGPTGTIYQQPQHAQLNWSSNY